MIRKLTIALLFLTHQSTAQNSTASFPPPLIQPIIYAVETREPMELNGRLEEKIWQEAPVVKDFFRNLPRQGGDFLFETFVRVVYDRKYLYFGVFCKDTAGKKGVRVQDFRRDFVNLENDAFQVQLDPQNLKRFCVSFQVTPLGTQRDMQVFDDQLRDSDWDAVWKTKTTITDSGWFAEIAIPFSSLRYAKPVNGSVDWNVIFTRVARRDFEQTVFPKIPQSLSPYNMAYGASLRGLKVPPPSINLRFQPYALFQHDKITGASGITGTNNTVKAGGELKWAINPHSVLDLTYNTDFAQADIDRAVNNLSRFNVLFPERRQFFLENQGVFAGSTINGLKPFFSRTIGLSGTQFNSVPIPIDGGIRFTDRNRERTIAGLYIHQRGTADQAAANFSVFRYLRNYKSQNNIGFMVTHKLDEPDPGKGFAGRDNTTFTMDGFIRPNQNITIQYLATASRNNTNDSIGYGSYFKFKYFDNKFFFYYVNRIVNEKYVPGMGFVSQNNVIYHQTVQFLSIRPKHKKWSWIREYEVGFDVDYYQNASDLKFQQAELYIYPVYIIMNNGGLLQYAFYPTWQNINFDFSLLGTKMEQKRYYYTRHRFDFNTNQSKKISITSNYVFGDYYNGSLQEAGLGLRLAPDPKIAVTASITHNKFRELGLIKNNFETNLFTVETRLAFNANIQATLFYQYNTFNKQGQWNFRSSWQLAPLSFIYLVFNETGFDNSPVRTQSVINKITYLKQF